MPNKFMLIDAAQPEETRVAVMDGKRLENFDIESLSKKQLKGNIYLAKVTRVEPSLQAAFVNYGGNRHGFLPFSEIHPDYYRIPVEDRERLLAEQEELSRQLAEEAKAREERELAAAEERAARIAAGERAEDIDSEDDTDEPLDDLVGEDDDDADAENDDAHSDAEVEEASKDVEPGAEVAEEEAEETETDDAESQSDEDEDGEADEAENEGEEATQDGEVKNNRGRRGRRGRGRTRGRRGLRSRTDQVIDASAPDEDDGASMTSLWKRMRRSYKIQEVIKRGQIMLIQVVKEERGNKGAAVTTYITMPGRYCVLMPNSPQSGGVSRKVAGHADRRKMRALLDDLQVPAGMSVILRTAGVDRAPEEVKRDLDYLMRLWDKVRDITMESTAPYLVHEEGSLVKRAIRDLYTKDMTELVVEGADGAETAREMMGMMMPEHVERVRSYDDAVPLFVKHGVEAQIDAIHSNTVTLKSGGYLVINPTEALVSIDINSGRATRERHIEETALKTNLEAADEIARQLRLRDLGGLVVIDFIDMETRRHNSMVERRMRDALSGDRARVQVGRISSFGLMELSRQRLRPSLTETHFQVCPHCHGLGIVRTTEAMALAILRAIESVGMDKRSGEVAITLSQDVATFLFNAKRATLANLEARYKLNVVLNIAHVIESEQGFEVDTSGTRTRRGGRKAQDDVDDAQDQDDAVLEDAQDGESQADQSQDEAQSTDDEGKRKTTRRRGRRGGRNRRRDRNNAEGETQEDGELNGNVLEQDEVMPDDNIGNQIASDEGDDVDGNTTEDKPKKRTRRTTRTRTPRRNSRKKSDDSSAQDEALSKPVDAPKEPKAKAKAAPAVEELPIKAPDDQQAARAYERVNEVSGPKKKGWWKKLTG